VVPRVVHLDLVRIICNFYAVLQCHFQCSGVAQFNYLGLIPFAMELSALGELFKPSLTFPFNIFISLQN
jgi:hypothetical protein